MKIIVDYQNKEIEILSVKKAKYSGNYTIRIKFNDGSEKLVDFKPFLAKSQHPSIKKYLDETLFEKFNIIDGNLNWNDYDLIFPISDLYKGEIKI
jgi:hypothetical protein